MLDERILGVLARLEQEDDAERTARVPAELRSRQVARTTGRFLFALAAAQPGTSILELGGSRGYSGIWLAAGARLEAGRVVSVEHDPDKCAAWRVNMADAGLEGWAELVEGDAFEVLREVQDTFDLVFLDAEKEDYEALFELARPLLEVGGLVVADNVLSHADPLAAYSRARQSDETLSSLTLPLDRGLELTTILAESPPG
jgi:predicted O-methyltransferase YrrM